MATGNGRGGCGGLRRGRATARRRGREGDAAEQCGRGELGFGAALACRIGAQGFRRVV
jgi:hypothetical protein